MSEPENEFAALMARVRLDDNQALAKLIALYEPEIRAIATCTQQGRSVFEYLEAAVEAWFADAEPPMLLPGV